MDFEYGVPDLRSFPMRDWLWAMGVAGRTATTADLGDEAGAGATPLREVLAAYLRRVRGAVADPDEVFVCAGFRYGLNLVLRALLAEGVTTAAVEDPGPVDHEAIAQRSGMRVVPVPVDELGLDVAALSRTSARVVVVTPAHQAPTGVVLAPERRHELVEWAHRVDGFVVEDDYDAEFRYDRQPVGAVQGLAPDRVIAMGSTSKTLSPTLRMGWLVCPPRLHDAILTEKALSCRSVPQLDQVANRASDRDRLDRRHLRRVRDGYRRGATPSSRPSTSTCGGRPSRGWMPATTRCSSCLAVSTRAGSSRRLTTEESPYADLATTGSPPTTRHPASPGRPRW